MTTITSEQYRELVNAPTDGPTEMDASEYRQLMGQTSANHYLPVDKPASAPRQRPEQEWQETVIAGAQLLGWRCYHTFDSRHSVPGYPDLTLFHPVHGVLFVELKAPNGRLTEAQRDWGRTITEAGYCWMVAYPDDWDELQDRLRGVTT